MTMDTIIETDIEQFAFPQVTEPGDHDKFSHYAPKDEIMEAMVNGTPTMALCGKFWIPTRDGKKFPICPQCKVIWETLSDI